MESGSKDSGPFAALSGHAYISLITFRKTGDPVATPIWFVRENGRVYGYSVANAGKVKRMRRNQRVQIAPCTASGRALGPYVEAIGRLLPVEEGRLVSAALSRKYGLPKRVMDMFAWFRPTQRAFFEIVPAED